MTKEEYIKQEAQSQDIAEIISNAWDAALKQHQWNDAYKETPKVGRKILVMFEDGVYDIAKYSKVTWGGNPKGFWYETENHYREEWEIIKWKYID